MTQFALITRSPAPSQNPITPETMTEVGPKWGAFLGRLGQLGALKGSYQTKYERSVLSGASADRSEIDLGADTLIGVMSVAAKDLAGAEATAADVPTLRFGRGAALGRAAPASPREKRKGAVVHVRAFPSKAPMALASPVVAIAAPVHSNGPGISPVTGNPTKSVAAGTSAGKRAARPAPRCSTALP